MNLEELILSRHTARKFKDEKKLDTQEILEMLMYASMGPSKANAHPVEFVVVEDGDKLNELSKLFQFGTMHIKKVPQLILVLGDRSLDDKVWIEESAIAASFLTLLLQSKGLYSGWVNLRGEETQSGESAEEKVREIFNIPEKYGVLAMISFGEKDEYFRARKPFDISSKVHFEDFGEHRDMELEE